MRADTVLVILLGNFLIWNLAWASPAKVLPRNNRITITQDNLSNFQKLSGRVYCYFQDEFTSKAGLVRNMNTNGSTGKWRSFKSVLRKKIKNLKTNQTTGTQAIKTLQKRNRTSNAACKTLKPKIQTPIPEPIPNDPFPQPSPTPTPSSTHGPINTAPIASSKTVTVLANVSQQITLLALDAEENSLTFTIHSSPSHGVLEGNAPELVYVPDSEYRGSDEFSFTASDGLSTSNIATVSLIVTDWNTPLGIPHPGFGIDELSPTTPNPWNTSTAGFYYVENRSGCSSSNSHNGTPSLPRCIMPNPIPAGSVVEIHGTYAVSGPTINSNGTSSNPIFIRGQNILNRPEINGVTLVKGSNIIFEYIKFQEIDVSAPAHHITIRHSEIEGAIEKTALAIIDYSGSSVHDILVYHNEIHDSADRWDDPSTTDIDANGIKIEYRNSGVSAWNVWIVENEIYHMAGNGIAVGDHTAAFDGVRNVYIGRNRIHHNRQTNIGIKRAMDVIVSENELYGAGDFQGGNVGGGVVWQYGPENVWVINNKIYDSQAGIKAVSNSSSNYGQTQYHIGNLIYNIHSQTPAFSDESGAAITVRGGGRVHNVNNTIYDVDKGIIMSDVSETTITLENNIISNVTWAQGKHFRVPNVATQLFANNILYQNGDDITIGIGGSTFTLPGFQTNYPTQGAGLFNLSPLFMNPDPDIRNFHLQANSPAVDTGLTSNVYDTFQRLYGIDIRKDLDGVSRPQGNGWDMGAYEYY